MDVTRRIRTALTRVSPTRLQELRQTPYVDYLQTPEWRRRRDERIRAVGRQCQRCAARRDLQVHHLSYERLGDEWDTDLEVLCRSCHENHHFDESRRQHIGIYVKLGSEALKAGARTVPDLTAGIRDRCRTLHIPDKARSIGRAVDVLLERMPVDQTRWSQPAQRTDAVAFGKDEAREICRRLGLVVPLRSIPSAPFSDPEAFVRSLERRRELDMDL